MNKLSLLSWGIIGIVIFTLSSITLFFSNVIAFSENITPHKIIGKNIYLGEKDLKEAIVTYKSDSSLGGLTLGSDCPIKSSYLGEKQGIQFFKAIWTSSTCEDDTLELLDGKNKVENTEVTVNLYSSFRIYDTFLDISTPQLQKALGEYSRTAEILSSYASYSNLADKDPLKFLEKNRAYKESVFRSNFIRKVLEKREKKYLIPVAGYSLPTIATKIPNAARGYRSGFTDGTHHSWDIDTPLGEKVIALDDGIVIRITSGWSMSSLSNLRKGENLSEMDMLRNLDILRGNQVWLKTMKGELVMYNHLDQIVENLTEGQFISRGEFIGTIGVSGVPEDGYTDYHLDFSIGENPYNLKKAGKYEMEDYMIWPWKFKGQSREYILAHQDELFESPSKK